MSTSIKADATHSSAQSTLPEVIRNYITASNEGRIEDAAACFAEDARVRDENRNHEGPEAIRQWIADSTREFQPKNEVLSVRDEVNSCAVISKVSGSFPGSPIELEFHFALANGKISHLVIR